jgi:hypothetical protein
VTLSVSKRAKLSEVEDQVSKDQDKTLRHCTQHNTLPYYTTLHYEMLVGFGERAESPATAAKRGIDWTATIITGKQGRQNYVSKKSFLAIAISKCEKIRGETASKYGIAEYAR